MVVVRLIGSFPFESVGPYLAEGGRGCSQPLKPPHKGRLKWIVANCANAIAPRPSRLFEAQYLGAGI